MADIDKWTEETAVRLWQDTNRGGTIPTTEELSRYFTAVCNFLTVTERADD